MYWRNKKKRAEIRVVVGLTKKNKNTNRLQYALNWLTLTDQHLDSETNAMVHKTKISKCHCNASFIRARQIEESRLHPRHRSMCQREVFTIRSYPWRRALNALSFAVWSETSVPQHQKRNARRRGDALTRALARRLVLPQGLLYINYCDVCVLGQLHSNHTSNNKILHVTHQQ